MLGPDKQNEIHEKKSTLRARDITYVCMAEGTRTLWAISVRDTEGVRQTKYVRGRLWQDSLEAL